MCKESATMDPYPRHRLQATEYRRSSTFRVHTVLMCSRFYYLENEKVVRYWVQHRPKKSCIVYLRARLFWRGLDWRCWNRSIRLELQSCWPTLVLLYTASRADTFAFLRERDPAWRLLSACPFGCIFENGRPDKPSAGVYWSHNRWMPGTCIRCFLQWNLHIHKRETP